MSTESAWHLYIVENRLGHWYTGVTTDVGRRLAQHSGDKAGGAKALRGKGPLQLIYSLEVGTKSQACKTEYWVKSLSKDQKKRLVAGELSVNENI